MKPPSWGTRMDSYERRRSVMPPEQRNPPIRQGDRETPFRLRSDATAATKLSLIAKRAREDHKLKFSTLMHHFSEENLEQCFHEQDGKKAVGVDGVRKEEYSRELDQNLTTLVGKLKRFSYRPQPVRRVMIPKEERKLRPIGISIFEDKLVQSMAAKILEAIYEQDFMECSYGFRPGRGCHSTVRSTYQLLMKERVGWVVDLDVRAYFDSVDHKWLVRCLQERVSDRKFLRLIQRMLKAGVLTEGEFQVSEEGTPQGSIVSPVLSNIYLHYVMDLWFEKVAKKKMKGYAAMRRYADDIVVFFQHEEDARRFMQEVKERMGKFGLSLHPQKTRLVRFQRYDKQSGIFDFLGFTFYWGKTGKGLRVLKCRTSKKRFISKVKRFKEWIKGIRNRVRLREIWKGASQKLQGHFAYYGVSWNSKKLGHFYQECWKLLYKWLNRRSQRRSFSQEQFKSWLRLEPLPQPRVVVRLF